MKIILVVILALVVVSIWGRDDGFVVFREGGYKFVVPVGYTQERNDFLAFFESLPGFDVGGDSFFVEIPLAEIKQNVAGFRGSENPYQKTVLLSVSVLNEKNLAQAVYTDVGSSLSDMWYGLLVWENRIIEAEPGGSFRVYDGVLYPTMWDQLKLFPFDGVPMPRRREDFLIASCLMSGVDDRRGSAACRTDFLVGNVRVEFDSAHRDLGVLAAQKSFFRGKLLAWMGG